MVESIACVGIASDLPSAVVFRVVSVIISPPWVGQGGIKS